MTKKWSIVKAMKRPKTEAPTILGSHSMNHVAAENQIIGLWRGKGPTFQSCRLRATCEDDSVVITKFERGGEGNSAPEELATVAD